MTRFNQDGNLLGRVTALAAIVAVVVVVGRLSCGDVCPATSGCAFAAGQKSSQ